MASGILSIASWHWLFAINVPLGLTALLLGIKHLPRQEERTKRKFDYISAIANAVTFGLLIYTLDGFAHHEKMDFLFIQLIVLAVVGTYYVRRQLTQTTPLLPLDLLRIPIFPAVHPDFHLFFHSTNDSDGFFAFFSSRTLWDTAKS